MLLCGSCLPFLCHGQQNKLIVTAPELFSIKRGETAKVAVKVSTLPGFHVNSDKPKDEFLIPLALTWNNGSLEQKSIVYPKPEEIKVGNETLSVFTGTFEIETEFKAPEKVGTGPTNLTGKVRYQACNNQMCFRPSTIEFRVPAVIE